MNSSDGVHSWFSAADPASPEARSGGFRGGGSMRAARASPTETARPLHVSSAATDAVCHRVLDFVVAAELGGRQNVVAWNRDTGPRDGDEQNRWALQLAVERCRPTDAAIRKTSVHVCRYSQQRPDQGAILERCWTMHSDATPEEVHMRKRQRGCWDEVELVGGILSGNAPDLRRSLLRAVRAAATPPGLLLHKDPVKPLQQRNGVTSESPNESDVGPSEVPAVANCALMSLLADSDDDSAG